MGRLDLEIIDREIIESDIKIIKKKLENNLSHIEILSVGKCNLPIDSGAFSILYCQSEILNYFENYHRFIGNSENIHSKIIKEGEINPESRSREIYFLIYKR